MSPATIITQLQRRGVTLTAVGNSLEVDGPESALTEFWVEAVRESKLGLLELLAATSPPGPVCGAIHWQPANWREELINPELVRVVCRHCGRFVGYWFDNKARSKWNEAEDQRVRAAEDEAEARRAQAMLSM